MNSRLIALGAAVVIAAVVFLIVPLENGVLH